MIACLVGLHLVGYSVRNMGEFGLLMGRISYFIQELLLL